LCEKSWRKNLQALTTADLVSDHWYGTDGPHNASIVIVGESWGSEEAVQQKPFVGSSGIEYNRILEECGIDRRTVFMTNMVAERPQSNETYRLFIPSIQKPSRTDGLAPSEQVKSEIRRLYRQIVCYPRKLVIATGNWSLWSLSKGTTSHKKLAEANGRKIPAELQTWAPGGIIDWRGSMLYINPHPEFCESSEQAEALKKIRLLPVIHPAAIMRAWYLRAPTTHDFKTRVPMALRDDWRPNPPPVTLSPPTFNQAVQRLQYWLTLASGGTRVTLANDIETLRRTFISVTGFADSSRFAMCIPFIQSARPNEPIISYWTPEEEATLIGFIRRVLSHPNIYLVGQNYIYDIQYIQHWWGVTPRLHHDTMLAQNVVFPGTPKDLGYLSSLYCTYHWYWKEEAKDWNTIGDLKQLLDYNCTDNLRTWEIAEAQINYIKAIGQQAQMDFKMQTNHLCLRMMNRGVLIDKARRGAMVYDLETARAGYYRELEAIIPQSMVNPEAKTPWYRSPQQTATLFYDILGFQVVKNRKTGSRTVGKEAFPVLKRKYPEFTGLFDRLDMAGSVDNSLGVVQSPLDPDGRMRCSYNPSGAETHRLSSSANVFGRGTNLQNLTKGEEDE
jgi:uracil-DNA glycosylase